MTVGVMGSGVALALEYGTPMIAFVGDRADIRDLPESVVATDALGEVMRFVGSFAR